MKLIIYFPSSIT